MLRPPNWPACKPSATACGRSSKQRWSVSATVAIRVKTSCFVLPKTPSPRCLAICRRGMNVQHCETLRIGPDGSVEFDPPDGKVITDALLKEYGSKEAAVE